jgi:hypothetical protein
MSEDPWVESRSGGLFFVNALLIFPHVMVTVPLVTRVLVRAAGGMQRELVIVDTFPELAEYLLPRAGWLLVIPIFLVVANLRMERAFWPRAGLFLFLFLHLAYLGWTVATWAGLTDGALPGAWPR